MKRGYKPFKAKSVNNSKGSQKKTQKNSLTGAVVKGMRDVSGMVDSHLVVNKPVRKRR